MFNLQSFFHRLFLFKTKFGRSFHHILEMPLFVSSAVTPAVQFADIFAGIVRHYYENKLDQKEPGTEFQEWLVELFTKLHNLTENNFIPKSHYLEYGFQKMGKNFSYPVSEKFTTSDNDDESLLSEEFSNWIFLSQETQIPVIWKLVFRSGNHH